MTAKAGFWARGLLRRFQAGETEVAQTASGGVQSGEPVEVYVALNEVEAQVVKSFLESNEIPVYLRGEAAGPLFGLTVGGLAQVSVLVPQLLASRAVELLEAQAQATDEEPGEGDFSAPPPGMRFA